MRPSAPTLTATQTVFGALIVLAASAGFAWVPGPLLRQTSEASRYALMRTVPSRLVFALSGLGGLAAYAALVIGGHGSQALPAAVAASCLLAVAVVDADRLLIPDVYALSLLCLGFIGPLVQPLPMALAGAAVGFGLLFAVREGFHRVRGVEGMGFGDVKLMTAAGALLGPERVLWAVVAGAVIGLGWAALQKPSAENGPRVIPFGAAAALPIWAIMVFGLVLR